MKDKDLELWVAVLAAASGDTVSGQETEVLGAQSQDRMGVTFLVLFFLVDLFIDSATQQACGGCDYVHGSTLGV